MIILDPRLQDAITIFLAIVIEATPFIILGVLFSGTVGAFIKDEWILKFIPKNRFLSHLFTAFLGLFFPVCECGNVPIVRKLLEKGFSPSQTITFFLSAPILNFVVIITTLTAFGGSPIVVLSRFAAGVLIAVIVGIIISFHPNQESFLTPLAVELCEHDHSHKKNYGLSQILKPQFFTSFLKEFWEMENLLIVGAAIAAGVQVFLSRDFVYTLNTHPLLAILGMMTLAIIISVCSTVDAFVAFSYAKKFSPAPIVAFLIISPMLDLKAMSMLLTTYKPKLVGLIIILVISLTILFSLGLSYLGY